MTQEAKMQPGTRILIVDDEPRMCESLEILLGREAGLALTLLGRRERLLGLGVYVLRRDRYELRLGVAESGQ